MSEHSAENDAATTERCPGSLRQPMILTTVETSGQQFGKCRRCGEWRQVRPSGVVKTHTRPIPPEVTP